MTEIIFEAGATHTGFSSAIELCKRTKMAGANGIKFQLVNPDKLILDKKIVFKYDDKEVFLYDLLKKRFMEYSEWGEIIKCCNSLGIKIYFTVTSFEDIKFVDAYDLEVIKICSGDINYVDLIKEAVSTGRTIEIDTGCASINDLANVASLVKTGGNSLIINYCPPGYPALSKEINLNVLRSFKVLFNCDVAYSSHAESLVSDLLAIGMKAVKIEKTITLDKKQKGPEHKYSLSTLEEMQKYVLTLWEASEILTKKNYDVQKNNIVMRAAYANKNLRINEIITEDDVFYSRPAFEGACLPDDTIIGKKIKIPISKDSVILKTDIR